MYQKERPPSALPELLRTAFSLKVRNSLRSDSLTFYTAENRPPPYLPPVRPENFFRIFRMLTGVPYVLPVRPAPLLPDQDIPNMTGCQILKIFNRLIHNVLQTSRHSLQNALMFSTKRPYVSVKTSLCFIQNAFTFLFGQNGSGRYGPSAWQTEPHRKGVKRRGRFLREEARAV